MANCLKQQDGTNALMVDVILQEMFQYLSWKDLGSCRRVCTKWYDCSQRWWLDAAPPLKLINYYGHKRQLNQYSKLASSISPRFSYRWEGVRHYRKVDLENVTFSGSWFRQRTIWNAYGQWMTIIRLEDCKFTSLEAFRSLAFGKATPNMKSLEIRRAKFYCSEYEILKSKDDALKESEFVHTTEMAETKENLECFHFEFTLKSPTFPIFWREFFSYHPNLKAVGIGGYMKQDHTELIRLVDAMKLQKSLKWIRFTYSPEMSLPHEDFMMVLGLFEKESASYNFTSLKFTFQHNSDLDDKFRQVKEKFQHLKSLSLYGNARVDLLLRLPPLKHLRVLSLYDVRLNNVFFLKELPTLSSLSILRLHAAPQRSLHMIDNTIDLLRTNDDNGDDGISKFKLPVLRKLSIEIGTPLGATHVVALKTWMPNLIALKLHLDNASLRALCEHFSRLETLYIYQGKVSDEGLIGYSIQDDDDGDTADILGAQKRQLPLFSNITDLKVLEDVVIFADDDWSTECQRISELAIVNGLLHLKYLNKVSISRSCMTEKGYNAAVKTLGSAFKRNVPTISSEE